MTGAEGGALGNRARRYLEDDGTSSHLCNRNAYALASDPMDLRGLTYHEEKEKTVAQAATTAPADS